MNLTQTLERSPLARLTRVLAVREREVRDTLWILASVCWIIVPHVGVLPTWSIVTAAMLIIWRGWITWSGRRLPGRIVLLTLLVAAAAAVYLQFHTIFGKDAGVTYLVILLGLKLLEMRAKRDIFVVICLSMFVMLTGLFESQSVGAAAGLMIGVWLLITALVRANFEQREPSLWLKLRLSGQICLLGMPLMVVLFVLFPRVQGPLWGLPADAYGVHTGLSDSMSPGSFTDLAESNEIAFRALFQGRRPLPSERYWRGPVFNVYAGRVWRAGFTPPHVNPDVEGDPASLISYTITLEPSNRPAVYLLDAPASAPEIPGMTAEVQADLQTLTSALIRERVRVEARSYTRFTYGKTLSVAERKTWLQLPTRGNPRTRAFAQQLRAQNPDDRKLANGELIRIQRENFVYTLSPPVLGNDSVDEFLFDTKRGFCEHYAGAFVFLMRAAGIPARVVTGYLGGEVNPVDGYIEVRQRDAHAWAEIWLEGEGWTRMDPTAAVSPQRIELGVNEALGRTDGLFGGALNRDRGWLQLMRFNMEAVANSWNQYVLSYSTDEQAGLLSRFGIPQIDWQTLTIALIVIFALVLLVLSTQVILRRPRKDLATTLYLRLCAVLARGGHARNPAEGPRAYYDRVGPSLEEPLRRRRQGSFRTLRSIALRASSHPCCRALAEISSNGTLLVRMAPDDR